VEEFPTPHALSLQNFIYDFINYGMFGSGVLFRNTSTFQQFLYFVLKLYKAPLSPQKIQSVPKPQRWQPEQPNKNENQNDCKTTKKHDFPIKVKLLETKYLSFAKKFSTWKTVI
jgi:hypothetical protein